MNIEQAKTIPLAQILDKLNLKPSRTSRYDLFYLSPFRQEKTASFHVDITKNLWYDHGSGEGGDVVTFVCKHLQNSGVGHAVPDALRWIAIMFGHSPVIAPLKDIEIHKDDRKLVVSAQQEINHPALVQYLEQRGLSLPLVQQYLKEVTVYNRESRKSIFALGFKNDKGGYEFRNKYFKGSTKLKYITFIRGEGGKSAKPEGIHLFEGWPDYISAIIRKRDGRKFEEDSIVLNSLVNLPKATPYIKGYGYRTVYTWMDNDNSGRQATANLDEFIKTEENLTHIPMNSLYAPYKDVNAWHMAKLGLTG